MEHVDSSPARAQDHQPRGWLKTGASPQGGWRAGGRPCTLSHLGEAAPLDTEGPRGGKGSGPPAGRAHAHSRAGAHALLRTPARLRAHALALTFARRALPARTTARPARLVLRTRTRARASRLPAHALTLRALRSCVLRSRRTVLRDARRLRRAVRELNALHPARSCTPLALRLVGRALATCLRVGFLAYTLLTGAQ